jgi:hypothetical protein
MTARAGDDGRTASWLRSNGPCLPDLRAPGGCARPGGGVASRAPSAGLGLLRVRRAGDHRDVPGAGQHGGCAPGLGTDALVAGTAPQRALMAGAVADHLRVTDVGYSCRLHIILRSPPDTSRPRNITRARVGSQAALACLALLRLRRAARARPGAAKGAEGRGSRQALKQGSGWCSRVGVRAGPGSVRPARSAMLAPLPRDARGAPGRGATRSAARRFAAAPGDVCSLDRAARSLYCRYMTRFLLPAALAAISLLGGGTSPAMAQSSDRYPEWARWLLKSGHLIEDDRACGFVTPDEVGDLYVAVLIVSRVEDGITPDRSEKVLRVVRDHARDAPVTPQICVDAEKGLPTLRGMLAPYMRAAKSSR